jgi:hypothetical protein
VRKIVVDDKLKYFGKILMNSCRPMISNRGSFPFLKMDNCYLLPQVRKSILKWAKIKNKLEKRYNHFRATLHNKTWYTIESDFDGHSRFMAF